ncbi:hypothetical protein E2C01_101789 [Portunus trituberculatus]|uniref:Uncharacterized protein n=1 Tax=Portunus trituberculatus TaxID=210409 RepID=A0A5B7K6J6_PORTR|nr:hypothetical protein [Portunus trituberculatus]
MDRFLLERTVILAQERKVRQIKSSLPSKPSGAKADKRLDEIEEQLKWLSMNHWKRRPPPPTSSYCLYCRATPHNPSKCLKRPEPGSCYDCLRLNCRKGQPNCPDRTNCQR